MERPGFARDGSTARRGAVIVSALAISLRYGSAFAIAPIEGAIERVEVRYSGGDRIAIGCEERGCVISVRVAGRRYRFDFPEGAAGSALLPKQLVLFSRSHAPAAFSFQVESDCSAFPESATPSYCIINFLVEDGVITRTSEWQSSLGKTLNSSRAVDLQ